MPFMKEMLYEAVFWRGGPDKPSFKEGLAYSGVMNALNLLLLYLIITTAAYLFIRHYFRYLVSLLLAVVFVSAISGDIIQIQTHMWMGILFSGFIVGIASQYKFLSDSGKPAAFLRTPVNWRVWLMKEGTGLSLIAMKPSLKCCSKP